MADWEWRLISEGGSKSIAYISVLPPNTSTPVYGGLAGYDMQQPTDVRRYRAKSAPISVVDQVRTKYQERDGRMEIEPKHGPVFEGAVTGWQSEYINGTDRYNVEVELTSIITQAHS